MRSSSAQPTRTSWLERSASTNEDGSTSGAPPSSPGTGGGASSPSPSHRHPYGHGHLIPSLGAAPKTPHDKDRCGLPWGAVYRPLASMPARVDLRTYPSSFLSNEADAYNSKQQNQRRGNPQQQAGSSGSDDSPNISSDDDDVDDGDDDHGNHGSRSSLAPASCIARCSQCGAFINPYCSFHRTKWRCSVCSHNNPVPSTGAAAARYASLVTRSRLPELKHPVIEFVADDEYELLSFSAASDRSTHPTGLPENSAPVVLIMLDLACSVRDLTILLRGAQACVEALPDSVRIGLMAFSDRIGLFQLRASFPHVRWSVVEDAKIDARIGMLGFDDLFGSTDRAELLPLLGFDDTRDRVSAALDAIGISMGVGQDADALRRLAGSSLESGSRRRAFGAAVRTMIDFFVAHGEEFPHIRVEAFLSGPPNFGVGALQPDPSATSPQVSKCERGHPLHRCDSSLQSENGFYIAQAKRAAESGIGFDLFVLSEAMSDNPALCSVGLPCLKVLSEQTGGNLCVFQRSIEEGNNPVLPREVFRQLRRTLGFSGLMRVRCTPAMRVESATGHMTLDDKYPNLWHVGGLDPEKSFVFNFGFQSSDGLLGYRDRPCVQIALAYTRLDPLSEVDPNSSMSRSRWRLRVVNLCLDVAATPGHIYGQAQPGAIATLLTHKIISAAKESSLVEARELVRDWVTILIHHYSDATKEARKNSTAIDSSLSLHPPLKFLPKLAFSLWSSPLLRYESDEEGSPGSCALLGMTSDSWSALEVALNGMSSERLRLALYPQMDAYTNLNRLQARGVSLSLTSLQSLRARIVLIRTAAELFCIYLATATDPSISQSDAQTNVAFPPPLDSMVHQDCMTDVHRRGDLPPARVSLIAATDPQANQLLRSLMVDDGAEPKVSFASFLSEALDNLNLIET